MVSVTRPLRTESSSTKKYRKDTPLSGETRGFLSPWPRELDDGLCKGDVFADAWSDPFEDSQLAYAKRICESCPIRRECYAIGVERLDDGVYGGVLLLNGAPTVLPKHRRKAKAK